QSSGALPEAPMVAGAAVEKIAAIGSAALKASTVSAHAFVGLGDRGRELEKLLALKNGFFAFESGLLVFPDAAPSLPIDLSRMNGDGAAWRSDYWHRCEGFFFFAADVFGGLFAIKGDAIVRFDPEPGVDEPMADTLEVWAAAILADHRVEIGWPLARDWQQ